MQVQRIQNNNNTTFDAIHISNKLFTHEQDKTAKILIKKLRSAMPKFEDKTIEAFYEKKGYDFVINPFDSDLVALSAYKGLHLDGAGIDKSAALKKADETYVGKYDLNSISSLGDDLKRVL